MVITQSRPKRKVSGGRYRDWRKKRVSEMGDTPAFTALSEKRVRISRCLGGHLKRKLLSNVIANVYDPKTKKYSKAKIETITDNPANRHFVRRNIMTKGTIIKTDKGAARITNRPGQEGCINAILL